MPTRTISAPHPHPHPPTPVHPAARARATRTATSSGPAARFPYSADRTYTPPDSGIREFEHLQFRLGLSRAVFVQASCHGTDNSAMVDALVRGAGPLCRRRDDRRVVHRRPTSPDLHDAGVRGTRFNFVAHLGGAPELDVFWRLVERVQPFGWHIVLHFDAKDLPHYADLLDAMPCPYVIDHMARVPVTQGIEQEPFQYLLELMRDERCWVKISGAERLTADGPPPVRRRRAVRPSPDRRRTRPGAVGHRLAAPQRAPHGRRRRPARPARVVRSRRRPTHQDPRRQPRAPLRLQLKVAGRQTEARATLPRSSDGFDLGDHRGDPVARYGA